MFEERPIIFNAQMINAILAGRKNQTRRIVKSQVLKDGNLLSTKQCPYGEPSDRLWVREKWRIGSWDEACGIWLDYCDGPRKVRLETDPDTMYKFLCQIEDDLIRKYGKCTNETFKWNPGGVTATLAT